MKLHELLVEGKKQVDEAPMGTLSGLANKAMAKLGSGKAAGKVDTGTVANQLKQEFANTYLKIVDEEHIFGKTLNIYHIKEITSTERCTDWSLIYHVKGTKLVFSERDSYCRTLNPNKDRLGFYEEELKEMIKITKDEFKEYMNKHSVIKSMLTEILG